MAFELSVTKTPPMWDTLPVYLLRHYPYTSSSYKPLCEVRGALYEDALYFRLTAYEWRFLPDTVPGQGSCIQLFLDGPLGTLVLTVEHGRPVNAVFMKGAQEQTVSCPNPAQYSGEDNTGDFWGVNLTVPCELLALAGLDKLQAGDTLSMNVTKVQWDSRAFHYGSLGKPVSPAPVPFDRGALVRFTIADY